MREQSHYTYNSLDYAEDLLKAGFDEKQAKAQAKALFRVIEQNAVTKQDLKELEVKLSHDIQNVQRDLKELDVRLTTQMKELDVRLTTQIKELELKIAHEMKELGNSLFIKLGGVIVVALTLSISVIGLLIHFLR